VRLALQPGLRKDKGWNVYLMHQVEVPVLWELLEPLLARAVQHGRGMVTCEGMRELLFQGVARAFILLEDDQIRAIFVAKPVCYDKYRAVRIIAAAGRGMKHAMAQLHVLEAWALTLEAVEVEGWCRPAMERLLRKYGFKYKATIVSLDLRRKLQ